MTAEYLTVEQIDKIISMLEIKYEELESQIIYNENLKIKNVIKSLLILAYSTLCSSVLTNDSKLTIGTTIIISILTLIQLKKDELKSSNLYDEAYETIDERDYLLNSLRTVLKKQKY